MQAVTRVYLGVAAALIWGLAAQAQAVATDRVKPLYQALGMSDLLVIMREEGLDYGRDLGTEMFPSPPGGAWKRQVDQIYAMPALEDLVLTAMARALESADIAPMLDFFQSGVGARIIELELAAREAMLDPDIDAAARDTWAARKEADTPRVQILRDFAAANSLIENNVVGALNSNFAFYAGLAEGNAFGVPLSEDEMLAEIWSQEDAIRSDTEDWMFSYLTLAYQPLSDADLEAYLAFSKTEAGQRLNRAIFEAFDAMFTHVSRDLGEAAAAMMGSQEL